MTAMTMARDGADRARAGDDPGPVVDVDYAKLVALLHSPHSASLHDRHAAAIDRVCRVHEAQGGIPLRELDAMERVVRFAYARVSDGHGEAFERTLCALMNVYAKPFVERATSDAKRHADAVVRALALVSECLALRDAPSSARIAACDAIRAFASSRSTKQELLRKDSEEKSLGERRALAASAGCAPACLRSLSVADAAKDPAIRKATLRALTELSRDAQCAKQMASVGVFDRLAPCFRLRFKDPAIFFGSELAWNVLEAIAPRDGHDHLGGETETERDVPLPGDSFFEAFADLLARATREARGDAEKDLRNELFVVARLLAERGGAWRASLRAREDAVRTAIAAGTIPEWPDPDASARVHSTVRTFPARERDFEMKRLAWRVVAELVGDEPGAETVSREHGGAFLSSLLAPLAPFAPFAGFPDHAGASDAAKMLVNRWSASQFADLQALALRSLARLASTSMDALVEAGAVETAIAAAAPDGRAPSDEVDGRRAAAFAFLERAARYSGALAERIGGSRLAIEAALWTFDPTRAHGRSDGSPDASRAEASEVARANGTRGSVEDDRVVSVSTRGFLRNGRVVIDSPTGVFGNETNPPLTFGNSTGGGTVSGFGTRNAAGDSKRARRRGADDFASLAACALLAALCDGDARNFRALRHAKGIATILRSVRALAHTDAAVPIAAGAATIAAVHRCVAPDTKNCALFAAGGGVGALLDATARCHPTLRPAILSTLADILENPKTHLFFHEWRSDAGRRALAPAGADAVALVLNLWRVEDDDARTGRGAWKGVPGAPDSFCSLRESAVSSAYVSSSRARASAEARALDAAARRGRHAGDGDDEFASVSDSIRRRVFAVCSLLGFDRLRRTCGRSDLQTLAEVERYVDMREGETWERTRALFEREGTFPIGPDRATMDAALAAAAETREALRRETERRGDEALAEALNAEAMAYEETRERWETEEAARWYRGDAMKRTVRERLTNSVKREAMLRDSFKGLSVSGRFSEEAFQQFERSSAADEVASR